jgi:hypothetical protein
LALAVATALEDRLLEDGRAALALVPAVRGPEFAQADYDGYLGTWRAGTGRNCRAPQVVALYEDGLVNRLESLGLAAYVGVPREEEWRIVHWDNDAGAMLLPVATARDLVDAVAAHTPWRQYAAQAPEVAPSRRRRAGSAGSPLLSRKIAIAGVAAGVAGPLLLASLPAPAFAASSAPQAPVQAGASFTDSGAGANTASPAGQSAAGVSTSNAPAAGGPSSATSPTPSTSSVTSPIGVLGNIQNFAGQAVTGVQNFAGQVGSAFQRSMELQGQAEITNAEANLAMGNAIVNRLPSVVNGASFFGDRGLVYGTTLGTIGGGAIGCGVGALGGGVGCIPGAIAGMELGGEIGFFGLTTAGMVGGGAYGAVNDQMPNFGPVEAQAYKYANDYGIIFGTGIGTIAGGIAGITRGAAAIRKVGELGFYGGTAAGAVGGGLAGWLGQPSNSTTPSSTTTLGGVPQGPGSLPQGFRNEFGLGPDGQPLGQNPAGTPAPWPDGGSQNGGTTGTTPAPPGRGSTSQDGGTTGSPGSSAPPGAAPPAAAPPAAAPPGGGSTSQDGGTTGTPSSAAPPGAAPPAAAPPAAAPPAAAPPAAAPPAAAPPGGGSTSQSGGTTGTPPTVTASSPGTTTPPLAASPPATTSAAPPPAAGPPAATSPEPPSVSAPAPQPPAAASAPATIIPPIVSAPATITLPPPPPPPPPPTVTIPPISTTSGLGSTTGVGGTTMGGTTALPSLGSTTTATAGLEGGLTGGLSGGGMTGSG